MAGYILCVVIFVGCALFVNPIAAVPAACGALLVLFATLATRKGKI